MKSFNYSNGPSSLPLSSKKLDRLRPTALSIDVTNLCNLKCEHCFSDSYKGELPEKTDKRLLDSVKKVLKKYSTITNITWYGGEPLINTETVNLVKEGVKLKRNNLVITNGTFPIPELHMNTHFAVSIDGTAEIHNIIRGDNIYNTIKGNILSAVSRKIPIAILYCINSMNINCIPDFLEEWSDKGTLPIIFTVYAPIIQRPAYLRLSDNEQNIAASLLLRMKKKYGLLIGNTQMMIELIRTKHTNTLANGCPMNIFNEKTRVYSIHMCNDGSIRQPCAFGRFADCLHCRSITKLALYAGLILRDKRSLFTLLGMYHSKPHTGKESLVKSKLWGYSVDSSDPKI